MVVLRAVQLRLEKAAATLIFTLYRAMSARSRTFSRSAARTARG